MLDQKKSDAAKAESIKIDNKATALILPENFDGLESGNGFRKLIAYAIHSNYVWVHSNFRLENGKNNKKKK